jgi:hypothetical protein
VIFMSDGDSLTLVHARHLLRRTGFGATPTAAQDLLDRFPTRGEAADHLLDFTPSSFKPGGRFIEDVHNKWVKYMIKSHLQLQEKLVLFWHDHFATSNDKVDDVTQMAEQNRLLRQNCKGNFKDFVKAINKNAAMMEFLDTVRNHKEQPNENYPRELQELFTLGVKAPAKDDANKDNNYDQEDIVQIARAFSGWDYDRKNVAVLNVGDHDRGDAKENWMPARGPKVIYKNRGGFGNPNGQSFDAGTNYALEIDNVIDIIFQHRYGPSANLRNTVADYIAQKLITYFAHPSPTQQFVADVVSASSFDTAFELTPLLHAIFVHDDFYLTAAPPAAGTKKSVKWPIDFVVSTLKILNMKLRSKSQYVNGGSGDDIRDQLTNMGQILLEPPSVFGWDWENSWVSSSTLLARYSFGRDVTGARGGGGTAFRPEKLFDLGMTDPNDIVEAVTVLLGVDDFIKRTPPSPEFTALVNYLTDNGAMPSIDLGDDTVRNRKLNGLVATILQSPIYQLH